MTTVVNLCNMLAQLNTMTLAQVFCINISVYKYSCPLASSYPIRNQTWFPNSHQVMQVMLMPTQRWSVTLWELFQTTEWKQRTPNAAADNHAGIAKKKVSSGSETNVNFCDKQLRLDLSSELETSTLASYGLLNVALLKYAPKYNECLLLAFSLLSLRTAANNSSLSLLAQVGQWRQL